MGTGGPQRANPCGEQLKGSAVVRRSCEPDEGRGSIQMPVDVAVGEWNEIGNIVKSCACGEGCISSNGWDVKTRGVWRTFAKRALSLKSIVQHGGQTLSK